MRYLSFVEEFILNPDYEGYIGGRVEIWDDGPWAEREIRFFTKRADEFRTFRDFWDFRDVTEEEVALVERTINERYIEAIT